jgi:hypothetical protein
MINYFKNLLNLGRNEVISSSHDSHHVKAEQFSKVNRESKAKELDDFCFRFIQENSLNNHTVVKEDIKGDKFHHFKCNDSCKFKGKVRRDNFRNSLDCCLEHSESISQAQTSATAQLCQPAPENSNSSDASAKIDLTSIRSFVLEKRGYLMLSIDKRVLDAQIEDSNVKRAAIVRGMSKTARSESKNIRVGGKWLSTKFEDDCMLKALSAGK